MAGHLYFIRSITTVVSECLYEAKTDVYMFGDIAGFSYFLDCLDNAKRGKTVNIRAPARSNGMPALVLSTNTASAARARVRFFERIIFRRSRPEMEFVVFGNRAGYQRLADAIRRVMGHTTEPLDAHVHLDDDLDSWIARRSIALNVRAPLQNWNRKALGSYSTAIFGKNNHRLPSGISYLSPWPYKLPTTSLRYIRI